MGASRRFLAQITRHQNEVKFISASLQYSNYAGQADFVVPYEIMTASQWVHDFYLKKCRAAMEHYADIGACGISRDAAGYLAPQSLRNVLVISATPYQWKHMIGQRTCRRNTDETRFVLLKIWADLYALDPELFSPELTGPFCQREGCAASGLSRRTGRRRPVKIKIIDFGLPENHRPLRSHANDAGADVYMPFDCTLEPGGIAKIPLGFGLEVPDGYAAYVFPRSSLAAKGVVCELPPVDSGYRGEIHAIVSNVGNEARTLPKDSRIGQLIIMPVVIADFVRGKGAFGSTGK